MSRLRAYFHAAVPTGADGRVWWLTLLASSGVTAVLPVLPLYAASHGADVAFVGWMVGAYMAANLLALYGAGWASDRFGRKPMMGIGMALMAVASIGFVLVPHPWAFAALRALEGVAAAALMPAAMAYVADRAPEGERGRRLAQMAIAENLGIMAGPIAGGALAAAVGLSAPFWVLAVACGVGTWMVTRLPEAIRQRPTGEEAAAAEAADWADVRWALAAGLAVRSVANGFSIGLYETVWSLLLAARGGSAWHISMSWTLFAVPPILLGNLAGRWIDRFGAARSAVGGAVFQAIVVSSYAFTGNVGMLLALCTLEGVGFAFSYPAYNALQVQAAPASLRGRMIGAIWAFRTVGALAGAVVTPVLYSWGPIWLFGVTSGVLMIGALGLGVSLLAARRRGPIARVPVA